MNKDQMIDDDFDDEETTSEEMRYDELLAAIHSLRCENDNLRGKIRILESQLKYKSKQTPIKKKGVMPFGLYKGDKITDVPDNYLNWVLRECRNIKESLREQIEEELAKRKDKIETEAAAKMPNQRTACCDHMPDCRRTL
jgi:hypothetical protein